MSCLCLLVLFWWLFRCARPYILDGPFSFFLIVGPLCTAVLFERRPGTEAPFTYRTFVLFGFNSDLGYAFLASGHSEHGLYLPPKLNWSSRVFLGTAALPPLFPIHLKGILTMLVLSFILCYF